MSRKLLILFFLVAGFVKYGNAQNVSIRGKVVDSQTGDPLPFANVFVNRTTLGTATDANGLFELKGVPLGHVELVFSYIGYESLIHTIELSGSIDIGIMQLFPTSDQLESITVESKRDKEWERNFKRFERAILGNTPEARLCEIQNPWVVDFEDTRNGVLVKAKEPIRISNRFLGYEIFFYLKPSILNSVGFTIKGNIFFTEIMSANPTEFYNWTINRHKSYVRSSRHLFKSIVNRQVRGNGFQLYADIAGGGSNTYLEPTDNFRKALGNTVTYYDTSAIFSQETSGKYKIVINGRMEVHYQRSRALIRAYDDIGFPVSWMALRNGYLYVDKEGIPLNPENLVTSGDMNDSWLVRMLPQDYSPKEELKNKEFALEAERIFESVYIHTDKPYYYPGERIWFKAYLDYFARELKDSLSRVLYVDLFSISNGIIQTDVLPINDSFAFGDFLLPDTVKRDIYFLRAYTQLMRNFGDSGLYLKKVPVLGITEKPDPMAPQQGEPESKIISIATSAMKYSTRDSIRITITARDLNDRPLAAHLSIAVTDSLQVSSLERSQTILSEYGLSKQKTNPDKMTHSVESGISLSGEVINGRGKSKYAVITMIDLKTKQLYQFETDAGGKFHISGLDFFDERGFTFEARNRNNKVFGSVVIHERTPPALPKIKSDLPKAIVETGNPQRINASYELSNEARLLDEVIITNTKIEAPKYVSTYGRPDFVLEEKDIDRNYPSIINSIYKILPEGRFLRSSNTSVLNQKNILVTVNDVPMTGDPLATLSLIDPMRVERVEITSRLNPMYGSQGVAGVLSVYLKKDLEVAHASAPNIHLINGFTRSRLFHSPDYGNGTILESAADYRSTIYWNPVVITGRDTGTTSVSFYAADLETTYRVMVEGVTSENIPVRAEHYITISNN